MKILGYAVASLSVFSAGLAAAQPTPQGSEFRLNSYVLGLQVGPDVAHTGTGSFVAVWISFDQVSASSDADVFGQRYDAGGVPAGTEFLINTVTAGSQPRVVVGADANGGFVVVWQGAPAQDGERDGIFGQRFDASGIPLGTEFQVNAYTTGDQRDPEIGVAADGSFVVVWEDEDGRDGNMSGVFGRRFGPDGSPDANDFAVNTFTTSYQRDPVIAVGDTGEFVVVWTGSGQDDSRTNYAGGVFGQRFTAAGDKTGQEFQVNQYTTGYQESSSVALQPDGGFIVAWRDLKQLSRNGIFGRLYSAGGAPDGGEFQVHSYVTAHKEAPEVAVDGDGAFTIVWTSFEQDGSSRGVFGRRFNASATPVSAEFQVNTYTTDSQYRARISDDGAGEVVVVWQRRESQPTDDVYGQRYSTSSAAGVCGDPVAQVVDRTAERPAVITATDALLVLQAAVGLTACELCICDVNGSSAITASDALAVLGAAVGQPTQLDCPPCT